MSKLKKKESACKIFYEGKPLDEYLEKIEKEKKAREVEEDSKQLEKTIKRSISKHIKPKYKSKKDFVLRTKIYTPEEIRRETIYMSKNLGLTEKVAAYLLAHDKSKVSAHDLYDKFPEHPKSSISALFSRISRAFDFAYEYMTINKKRVKQYNVDLPRNISRASDIVKQLNDYNNAIIRERRKRLAQPEKEKNKTPEGFKPNGTINIEEYDEEKQPQDKPIDSYIEKSIKDFIERMSGGKHKIKIEIDFNIRFGIIKD